MPIKVFEVSDIVLMDPTSETGACNKRRLSVLIYAKSPHFEVRPDGMLASIHTAAQLPAGFTAGDGGGGGLGGCC